MSDDTDEKNQYCVTVKLYTWALDKAEACDQVIEELDYLSSISDGTMSGFIHPVEADAAVDGEA